MTVQTVEMAERAVAEAEEPEEVGIGREVNLDMVEFMEMVARGGGRGAGGIGVMAIIDGGSFFNYGFVTVNSQSRLHVSTDGSNVKNYETITLNNGSFIEVFNHGIFDNHSVISTPDGSSGTMEIDTGGLFINHPSAQLSCWIENSGGHLINNGEAYLCFNHGEVSGGGLFEMVANYATVAPGDGIGKLVMENGYSGEGFLHMQLAGTSASPLMHDVLEIGNNFEIESETLVLEFAQGFDESNLNYGDFFDIIQYPNPGFRMGEFSAIIDTQATLSQGVWELVPDQEVIPGELYSIRLVYSQGLSSAEDSLLPRNFALHGPFPNPFNPATELNFSLPRDAEVSLKLYDVSGCLVRTLVSQHLEAGHHEVRWNGNDNHGRSVATGTYFARLVAAGEVSVKPMSLVR